jgi:hypothetical protein
MRLARPTGNDAIHSLMEGSCIESQHVAEELRVREAEPESSRRVRVVFDAGNRFVAWECGFDGEVKHADSRAEGEPIHATSCARARRMAGSSSGNFSMAASGVIEYSTSGRRPRQHAGPCQW